MGRFHRHDDGAVGEHHHHHDDNYVPDMDLIGDHSGYQTGAQRIEVLEDIYAENDHLAAHNREAFDASGVKVVNLMSSPGSGKTTLLERTLAALQGKKRVGIVEGDIETPLDADRLRGYGAQISLLNTGHGFGGECHLDAPMVHHALDGLNLDDLDLVIIENVGNLVCPAEFDVGEHVKAMVFSITEGEDKPLKYPVMFRSVKLVIVNKTDLNPYLNFDMAKFLQYLEQVNPGVDVIEMSALTGDGVPRWIDWLTSL